MGNETVISLRMGTIIVVVSIFVGILSSATTYALTYGYNERDREAQVEIDNQQAKDIDEIHEYLYMLEVEVKHYTDLEVGGLRSDWERELNNRKQ
jgi:hypothetical protein